MRRSWRFFLKKEQVSYKGMNIRLASDFPLIILKPRRHWNKAFIVLRGFGTWIFFFFFLPSPAILNMRIGYLFKIDKDSSYILSTYSFRKSTSAGIPLKEAFKIARTQVMWNARNKPQFLKIPIWKSSWMKWVQRVSDMQEESTQKNRNDSNK